MSRVFYTDILVCTLQFDFWMNTQWRPPQNSVIMASLTRWDSCLLLNPARGFQVKHLLYACSEIMTTLFLILITLWLLDHLSGGFGGGEGGCKCTPIWRL